MLSMEDKTEPTRQVLLSSVSKERMETFATLVTTTGKVVYLEDSVKQESLKASNKESLKQEESGNGEVLPQEIKQEVEYNVLTTSKQGNIKVVLYDGSHVWLNAGSELRYPNSFVENQRVVYLKGEAYFDVTKDESHPFIVKTIASEISVLGTSFNVNDYDGKFVTTLVSGKVQVFVNDKDYVLTSSMQVRVEGDDVFVEEVDVREFTAWKDGLFEKQKLREVMDILSRWYDVDVFYQNLELQNLHFTGTIQRHSEISGILKFLEKTDIVKFTLNGKTLIVSK